MDDLSNQFGGINGSARSSAAQPNDENRKLFLGGLSWETDEKDVFDYFNQYGKVDKVTIKYDLVTGRSRGFGFVTFVNEDAVDSVLKTGPHMIKNRPVDPKRPKGKSGMKKIFVGGIDGDMSTEEIRAYFEKFGNIENIERPFDRQRNRSRDFCFIIFENEGSTESAIATPKQVIGGKECDIKLAHPHRNSNQMNGGGMGRRGGPGGQGGFFKGRTQNINGNWRNSEHGQSGNYRGSGDDRYADTQFLTNIDTMPSSNYSGYKTYTNSNFFPNWNY